VGTINALALIAPRVEIDNSARFFLRQLGEVQTDRK
jgi:hypothetical protein